MEIYPEAKKIVSNRAFLRRKYIKLMMESEGMEEDCIPV